MKREEVDRLVAVSTGTAVDPGDGLDLKIRIPAFLIRCGMPEAYRDIVGLARTIRESQLDWTMVWVGFLKNRPASGRLNVGLYGRTKHSLTSSREEVARFMLDQVWDREFVNRAPGHSSP